MLDRLSGVLLEIHELPESVPFDQFQDAALTAVQQILPFDAAWWGLVGGLQIHTATRFNLPEGYRRQWTPISGQDPIARAALAAPFKTIRMNADDLAPYPEISAFLSAYDIRHVLCTTTHQQELGLDAFLSLYRSDQPFTEEDRQLNQALMPHLIHAVGQSWRNSLEQSLRAASGQPEVHAAAISDAHGLILSSEVSLQALMRKEWPSWIGPRLPDALADHLKDGQFRGRYIQAQIDLVNGVYLLRLSERDPLACLTAREAEVSLMYSSGHTYKEIARDLGLSPTTVRHYLRNAYGKLQVSNKVALSNVLSKHPDRTIA